MEPIKQTHWIPTPLLDMRENKRLPSKWGLYSPPCTRESNGTHSCAVTSQRLRFTPEAHQLPHRRIAPQVTDSVRRPDSAESTSAQVGKEQAQLGRYPYKETLWLASSSSHSPGDPGTPCWCGSDPVMTR